MKVEMKIEARLIDDDGQAGSWRRAKETGPAATASTMGRDLGRELGAALEKVYKKGA